MLLPRALGVALLNGCSPGTGKRAPEVKAWDTQDNTMLDSMTQKTPACPTSLWHCPHEGQLSEPKAWCHWALMLRVKAYSPQHAAEQIGLRKQCVRIW